MKSYKLLFAILLLSYCSNAQMYLDTPSVVQPVQQAGAFGCNHLTVLGNKLIFTSGDLSISVGAEWWSYDGVNTPVMAPEINPGSGNGIRTPQSGNRRFAATLNGVVYFSGINGTNGNEPYKWDGINAPQLIKDIMPGTDNSSPAEFIICANSVFFTADSSLSNRHLYKYNPLTNQTEAVHRNVNSYARLGSYNNRLYIQNTLGSVIQEYDPQTNQITSLPISPAQYDNFLTYGAKLYFTGVNPSLQQSAIYSYDGTSVTAIQSTFNIILNTNHRAHEKQIIAHNGKIYFWRSDNGNRFLYAYDTASSQVNKASGIGQYSSNICSFLFEAGNNIYYNDAKMLVRYNGSKVDTVLPFKLEAYSMALHNNNIYLAAIGYGLDTYKLYQLNDTLVPGTPPGASIQSINFKGDIQLYPNPTNGNTHLKVRLDNTTSLSALVKDITGRTVYKTTPALYSSGQSEIELPVKDLPAGTYVVSLVNSYGTILWSGKLLRQ